MKNKIRGSLLKFNIFRRLIQLLSFIFFSIAIFNLPAPPFSLPILWTWGLQRNLVGDAFTAVQLMFYNAVFPWLALASFLIVGILIGRSLCGWVCPFGFIQDLLGFIKRKKIEVSLNTHRSFIYVKYFILGITLLVSVTVAAAKISGTSSSYENALGVFAQAPFAALSPGETLFATVPRMILSFRNAILEKPILEVLSGVVTLPSLFWVQIFIMVGALIFAAYVPRSWCRYFCPHGAVMAVLNRFSFLGLRRDIHKCLKGKCRACIEACPMKVPIFDLPWEKISDSECIYCLKCVDICPYGALKLKYP
ncbi:MAG: 4Fe-4S binding protein [Candidatus Bathyarchaeia archaeon]